MAGLVFELQTDALNKKVAVSDLLRKALVISKKLGISQIAEWLNNELNGYSLDSEIPHYREIHGQVKVMNPYHGWQPLNFGDAEMADFFSKRKIKQPVSELESLSATKDSRFLQVPFSQDAVNQLMKGMDIPLQPALLVASTEIVGILDAVRNNILDWALQLEQEGILGDGMSFSPQERQTANQTTYQITNNIGNMQNSQIQQHSAGATQKFEIENDLGMVVELLTKVKREINEFELADSDEKELLAEIATIESQAQSPRPKKSIIFESLNSIKTILENMTGNILASGILTELAKYI